MPTAHETCCRWHCMRSSDITRGEHSVDLKQERGIPMVGFLLTVGRENEVPVSLPTSLRRNQDLPCYHQFSLPLSIYKNTRVKLYRLL